MGQSQCRRQCPFTDDELDEYQLLTFLNRNEILHVYNKFHALDPEAVELDPLEARLSVASKIVPAIPELRLNPFGDRVCLAFSSERDQKMGFHDFLDMYSVMSERAPFDLKVHFAFLTYDFDGDGVLGKEDLRKIIERTYHTDERRLTKDERNKILRKILDEADVDKDGFICKPEFKFALAKCPDFFHCFKMYL